MEIQNKKLVHHFSNGVQLPENSILHDYKAEEHKKNKKNKQKYDKFSYYKINENKIIKVLFNDEKTYIQLGNYPFTNPNSEVKSLDQLNSLNPQRLFVTQAAYIGHKDQKLILKKLKGIKLGVGQIQIDTGDDNFEVIEISNQERFQQFMKIMQQNPNASQMSIRIFINDTNAQKPEVLDYQFFFREQEIKTAQNRRRN